MSSDTFPLLRAAILEFAAEKDYEVWIDGPKRSVLFVQSRSGGPVLMIRSEDGHLEAMTSDDEEWGRIEPPDLNTAWRESIEPWIKSLLVSEVMSF